MAGCLFEVVLPVGTAGPWRWTGAGDEVTLLGESVRQGWHHFRFRAEAPGAGAGVVALPFGREGARERSVSVRIAPETFDSEG